MNFSEETDSQFENLQSNPSQFNQNYLYDQNCLKKRTIFAHTLMALKQVKTTLNEISAQNEENKEGQLRQIQSSQVPNITCAHEVINISQTGLRKLKEVAQQEQTSELDAGSIFKFLWRQFMSEIVFIIFLNIVEMACRLGFSVMLKELLTKIAQIEEGDNKRDVYLYAVFCGIIWLTGQIGRHNGHYEVPILVGRIRSQLVFLIYAKLSKISQYTAKTQQLGKIINMLSNDFNTMQAKASIFFAALIMPIALVGIIVILVTRFGWPGIIPILVTLFFLPFQILIGKFNGRIIQKVNVNKDKRVKTCTEIIEGSSSSNFMDGKWPSSILFRHSEAKKFGAISNYLWEKVFKDLLEWLSQALLASLALL